jgi:adenosine deaminase
MTNNKHKFGELTELHVHVGSAVDPPIMWEIAHEQGIKLPTKNYWEFEKLITVSENTSYESYLELFHWTELIQSSPEAIERSIYSIASGAYRKNNITTLEIRFNPMKRNRGGERDLDHIILAAIHGMEKAMIAYPIAVGLIFCLDRSFSAELNSIICKKAIKYSKRGVIGVDLAGQINKNFRMESLADNISECKRYRLGVTIHTGEATGASEVKEVLELLSPMRIGHGVRSIEDDDLLDELARRNVVLEICPSSNLSTQVVKNLVEFKKIFKSLKSHKVSFTINTDGPEMLRTNLLNEYEILLQNGILTETDLLLASKRAKQASFIKND